MHSKNVLNSDRNEEKVFLKENEHFVLYHPTTPGFRIRNAVTGLRERFGRVEGRRPVFKVSLNNGELGQCPHSNTMFFNSPSEYESLFYTSVSDGIKDKWRNTYNLALVRVNNKKKRRTPTSLRWDNPITQCKFNTIQYRDNTYSTIYILYGGFVFLVRVCNYDE
jgi:hypothetical protein